MTTSLAKGSNGVLNIPHIDVMVKASKPVDLSLLSLAATGKVRSDADMIFYNQPKSPDETIVLDGQRAVIYLSGIDPEIDRIIVAASVDNGSFADVTGLTVDIGSPAGPLYELPISGLGTETMVVLAEIYRRHTEWKIRHVGQGYATGLAGLATDYGIDVGDSEPTPVPAVAAAPEPAVVPTPEPAKVSTQKPPPPAGISMVKDAKINLTKKDPKAAFEHSALITCTTSWVPEKDFEIACIVLGHADENVEVVTYGTEEHPKRKLMEAFNGAVKHLGDVRSGGHEPKLEILEIRLTAAIRAIIVWVYSARLNGPGSFKKYKVTTVIDNHDGTVIQLLPKDMSNNSGVYTFVPCIIHNYEWGVEIEKIELYSEGGERRPIAHLDGDRVVVQMDEGETNLLDK